ncbi:MAG: nucleotidyltransferase family protein [Chromatiales bacterium]|nr:nucleotidyltransferase family protein [Chromatiales bacterium]
MDSRRQIPDGNRIRELFFRIIQRPVDLVDCTMDEQDYLLRMYRSAGLLGRIAHDILPSPANERCSEKLREQLRSAQVVANSHERMLRWEVNRIQRAVGHRHSPLILLKGAAYLFLGLPTAKGRLVADIDILVPQEKIDQVERGLLAAGWFTVKLDDYDQKYYREWMHELPPLRHPGRAAVVDVHHTILPPTSRLKPDPKQLFAQAKPLKEHGLAVLGPADMVLHNVVHLFFDGDLQRGLRQLLDLDGMLQHFADADDFWPTLAPRAQALGLARPLHYGLRYCRRWLATPIPEKVIEDVARVGAPPTPVGLLMDILVNAMFHPRLPGERSPAKNAAQFALYVRSHWLRMPPSLLFPHLGRKLLRRWTKPAEA